MSDFTNFMTVVWSAFDKGITLWGFTITFKEVMVFTIVTTMIFRFIGGFIKGGD